MPTPFYHIYISEKILNHKGLSSFPNQTLHAYKDAFLLGSTAADLQTISGQSRKETHFFSLPYKPDSYPPWEKMFFSFPWLRFGEKLPADQAAFLAGYLSHLLADWLWILEIFLPNFNDADDWLPYEQRIFYHNVMRAYLDKQINQQLSSEVRYHLAKAVPHAWLPFAKDEHIFAWRNLLVEQFLPNSSIKTVEVFAARQGITPEAFFQILNSEEKVNQLIFSHIPRERLSAYERLLVNASINLLNYWFSV